MDNQTMTGLVHKLPYHVRQNIYKCVHGMLLKPSLDQIVKGRGYFGAGANLKHYRPIYYLYKPNNVLGTIRTCSLSFEEEYMNQTRNLMNYPLNVRCSCTEELRMYARWATGKKRLSRKLTRQELVSMILKAA